ncbi:MAG: hypothetical protein IJS56_00840 [Bacilli bacterium]|nr:hypothetical protein [Bacilli bacterium]
MNNLQIINMINNFPIGDIPKSRLELLSKAEVISYLSRYQEQFGAIENGDDLENAVRLYLSECIGLTEGEQMPSIYESQANLQLSPGFLDDYSKIQYIKETNPNFSAIYDVISNNVELDMDKPKGLR